MAAQPKISSQSNRKAQNNANKGTPMIVQRVNKIPMVKFAVTVGFSQYDKLKSSNVTVGELMTRAEGWAAYVWSKVQPIVEKLEEPINRGDQIACSTFDFLEDKLKSINIPQSLSVKLASDKSIEKCSGKI